MQTIISSGISLSLIPKREKEKERERVTLKNLLLSYFVISTAMTETFIKGQGEGEGE